MLLFKKKLPCTVYTNCVVMGLSVFVFLSLAEAYQFEGDKPKKINE
jgi:hypothetical protein